MTCLTALTLIFASVALAVIVVPETRVDFSIADAVKEGEDIIVTVDIALETPSEPYASLEFNLVSSNHEDLAIINLGEDQENPDLDITFNPDYGQAYHKGRPDSDTGGYRYLMGIYSQTGGNLIDDAVEVCSVKLRYKGTVPQTLLIRDLKLVYLDDVGGVASAPINTDDAVLTIDPSLVKSNFPIWIVAIVAAVVVIAAVLLLMRRKDNGKPRAEN